MVDGVNRSSGYGFGGVNGFGTRGNQNENTHDADNQNPAVPKDYTETQVDPAKVMDWMAANNNFVNVINAPAQVDGIVTDPTIEERVAGFMENYEYFMTIIEQEFGEELAPAVMDVVMDKLMGMTE